MAVAIYVTPEELAEAMDQEPSELVQLLSNLAAIHEDDPVERADFIRLFAEEAYARGYVRILKDLLGEVLAAVAAEADDE